MLEISVTNTLIVNFHMFVNEGMKFQPMQIFINFKALTVNSQNQGITEGH